MVVLFVLLGARSLNLLKAVKSYYTFSHLKRRLF